MNLDRRLCKRYEANLPVQAHYVSDSGQSDTQLDVSSVSISESGISIVSPHVPIPSATIKLRISLPSPYPEVTLTGKVVWKRFLSKQNHYVYGVSISEGEEEFLDLFKTYLKYRSISTTDRRKSERRDKRTKDDDDNKKKREWDRRGNAKVFEKASRFLYKRVVPLKTNDLYFYLRTLESPSASKIIVDGKELIMLGSNNYLGLTVHPKVKEAAIKATEKYGSGAGSVRLLGGTLKIHNQLEEKLAQFKGAEAAIVYSAGYTANLATVSSLVSGENDIAIVDEKDHASIIDGCRLVNANMRVFSHNNMEDLERKLQAITNENNKIIIVDGVFSMDGDICDLKNIYHLAKKYDAKIMIDEAHASGVLGRTGAGTPEHFGLEGRIDVVMGTLSKALGGIGGFVAGSKTLIDYLKHSARAFVFSSALPPSVCASTMAAIDVIQNEPEWLFRLHENERYFRNGLKQLGFNTGLSCTPIVPVILGDEVKTYQMTKLLHELGVYVSPVATPAVKRRSSRIRASVMATHTREDLEKALDAFKKVGRILSIIP